MVICCSIIPTVSAQFLTHELGVHIGTSTIHTDYGERDNFQSNYANNATSISVTHTLHFFNKNQKWNANTGIWDNLAVRTELNMIKSSRFNHQGRTATSTSTMGEQLRAMEGSVSIINTGIQVEYYFKYLKDFMDPLSKNKWNPYVLGGVQYSMFSNSLESSLGDWRTNPNVLPSKYRSPEALAIGNGTALAASFGGGTRYKITKKMDLNIQLNWQYFFSDGVDGLKPDVPENKNNDWLMNMQMGIIYHLNFHRAL